MTTLEITTDRDQYERARGNAKGWYETIRDLYREYQIDHDADDEARGVEHKDKEDIEREVTEGPLSVLVRSGWAPLDDGLVAEEFEILLTTGGPGLRIRGDLDEHKEPRDVRLEMQDWGVPWREVWPCELDEMDECRAALLWYASHFYFGE